MRKFLFSIALMALPAGVYATPAQSLPGPVTYEVRTWGRILLHWRVDPDGTGEIWRRTDTRDGRYVLAKHRLRLDGQALRTFVKNVEDAREATRGGLPCKKEIYDLPYGTIIWDYPAGRQDYAFDAGCRSEAGDAAIDILTAATSTVETLAKIDAKPYIVEPFPPR